MTKRIAPDPRTLVGGMVIAAITIGAAITPSVAGAAAAVGTTQDLAELLTFHEVVSKPKAGASRIGTVSASRPITGGQTVLPVVGRRTTGDGIRWLRVVLPGRPNGAKGWIARRGTRLTTTTWHLVVNTSSRRVHVYRRGRLAKSFIAIVGKPSTPTPTGRAFVEESVEMLSGSAGGPYALALSVRSDVLQEFDGGPGQIAIHGVENLGGTLGTAASHGCIRLANSSVSWLAARIGPGVPITIVG